MRRARGTGQGRRQIRRRPESVATDQQLSLPCACAALCPQPIVPGAFPARLRLRAELRSWCFPDLLFKTQNSAVLFPCRGRRGSGRRDCWILFPQSGNLTHVQAVVARSSEPERAATKQSCWYVDRAVASSPAGLATTSSPPTPRSGCSELPRIDDARDSYGTGGWWSREEARL
jgi:hypothetical protein